ncbi:MAG TPA: DEAD/DEAH box helicase [bacterium]|nr:DEAD/DEAH box helicase [bacterium]
MTNPNLDNLQKELDQLTLNEQELEVKLEQLRAKRINKRTELEGLIQKIPMTVKVIKCLQKNGEVTDPTFLLENNPVKYHREYVTLLHQTIGRFYDRVAENINHIPASSLEELLERLKLIPTINVDWDFQTYQAFQKFKAWQKKEEAKPNYKITLKDERFQILKVKGGMWDIDKIEGIKKEKRSKDEISWSLPKIEGWRIEEALEDNPKVEWSEEAKAAIEVENEKRERLSNLAGKLESSLSVKLQNGYDLRPFQEVAVEFIDCAGGDAIIADMTGLGKTWEAIGYIEYKKLHAIIICPAAIKENWRRHIKNLTGEDAYICKGSTPSQWDVEHLLTKKPRYVIINYDIFGKGLDVADKKDAVTAAQKDNREIRYLWAEILTAANYDIAVCDEAHKIKNTSANRTRATLHLENVKWLFLTATPILNRPRELYSYLRLIRPGQYSSEDNFCNQYIFMDGSVRNVDRLRKSLSTIMIRRKREDVQKELPKIERIYDWHELSPEARDRYEIALEGLYQQLAEFDLSSETIKITGLLAQITRLKQIVAQDKVDRIADLALELSESYEVSPAADKLGEGKVVIFSGFKAVARGIGKRLGHEAVVFDGDTKQEDRQRYVDQFQSDPGIKFLVATGFVAGEGLDMTKAGYVIFSDFGWTPAYHQQCEGRIYGRLNECHGAVSYYVVGSDTIEEWIQEILARKLKIIEQIVEGNDSPDAGKSMGYELIKKMKTEMRSRRK